MRIYVALVLFLYVKLVCGFSLDQIVDRLNYIEDRINAESKFRRDDFSTLYDEISSIKAILQQSLNHELEEHTDKVEVTEKSLSNLVERVEMLTKGFKEEKNWNMRFRREMPELQRNVQDLKTMTDHISASLEDILKGIKFLGDEKTERQETINLQHNEITGIKRNIVDIQEQFEQTKATGTESLDRIKNDTEVIRNNTEHLKHSHELCLKHIAINNNLTKELEEKLENTEAFGCKEKNVTNRYEEVAWNSSISSSPVTSTPKPSSPMTTYISCLDLYHNGFKSNNIYEIEIEDEKNISVYCDMTTDGGGWTVFQRRQDGSVDFFRGWNDYRNGFGNLTGEFWLGNEYINLLTDNDEVHELRIELEDHDGVHAFAKYSNFKVGPLRTNYKLEVSGYTGNAGDSLSQSDSGNGPHDQKEFTTKYRDNDYSRINNCALKWQGAWWFNQCFDSHLNGLYHDQPTCKKQWLCIVWDTWKGSYYSLKFTEMKFR